MFQDLRFGARMLLKNKGFTIAAAVANDLPFGGSSSETIFRFPGRAPGEPETPGSAAIRLRSGAPGAESEPRGHTAGGIELLLSVDREIGGEFNFPFSS